MILEKKQLSFSRSLLPHFRQNIIPLKGAFAEQAAALRSRKGNSVEDDLSYDTFF
jgi:hypothetical protein